MSYGLPDSAISDLCRIFSANPKVDKVVLYGSRAKGTFRNGSDIDLTLYGQELTLQDLNFLEHEIDDLLLPYKVDLSIFSHIDNPDLVEHIQRVGKTFYPQPINT